MQAAVVWMHAGREQDMMIEMEVRPTVRGRVIGLGLGQSRFVGGGVGLMLGACLCASALAGPDGATVAAGSATIRQNGTNTTITASNGAIINYSSFNLKANESVRFIQPSAQSRVLNRINSSTPSLIDGSVSANGIVYFVNRAGVRFGPNSILDVGGIYAAASNLSNADFLSGVNRFTGAQGEVINEGRISANVAALIGDRVSNAGTIDAPGGIIAMVAGNDVTLSERGGTMTVKIEGAANNTPKTGAPAVENTGTLNATRGSAFMVAGDMYSLAVRNTGDVKARDIRVEGKGATRVEVSGNLDATNQRGRGKGGSIHVTAQNVELKNANLDASGRRQGGEILVGGDFQGGGGQGALRTAQTTGIDAGSTLKADATNAGDGGRVIVWSDHTTTFAGNISANGGAISGNGGLIETSGKINLDIRGAVVNARSVSGTGNAGLWLLDPVNVTIDDPTGGDDTAGGIFTGTTTITFDPDNSVSPAIVDVNTINAALNMGTNVTITTGSVGTDAGHINVNAAITKSAGTDATLSFLAAGDINVNSAITSSMGALNLVLQAGGNVGLDAVVGTNGGSFMSSGVNFTQGASGSLSTLGGNVGLTHTGAVGLGAVINTGGGNFSSSGVNFTQNASASIGTTGGNTLIDHTGAVSLGAVINTGGGTFTSKGVNYTQDASASISTAGGNALIDHTGTVSIGAALNVGGTGSVTIVGSTFSASATVTGGSAGISLRPANSASDIRINNGAGDFNLSATTLGNLVITGPGALTIGAPGNTGSVLIGSSGNVDISGLGRSVFIHGSIVRFNGALTIDSGSTLRLTTNDVQDNHAGTDAFAGILHLIVSSGGSATLGTSLSELVANVAGNLTIDNATSLILDNITVGGNLEIRNTGILFSFADINVTGTSLFLTRTNGGASMNVGSAMSTFGGAVTLRSRNNADIADAAGNITIQSASALTLAGVATTGTLSVSSGGTITGTGIVKSGAAGFTAAGDVVVSQLQAAGTVTATTTSGGNVTLTNSTGITLGAGSSIGGDLSLTAATGNINVQTTDVAGTMVTLSTLASNATITTASLTGPTQWNVSTVGASGNAAIAGAGDMFIASNVGGVLAFTSGGNVTLASVPVLNLGASSATGFVTITAPDLVLSGLLSAGAAGIILQPDNDSDTVGINSSADFSLSGAELLNLSTTGTVTIGRISGTGVISVGGLGAVDLSTTMYDLTFRGGQVSFSDGLTLADDHLLTLATAGVASPNMGTDVTIGGTNGRILLATSGAVDLSTSVAKIAGSTSAGAIAIVNGGALEIGTIGMVAGLTGAPGQNVSVSAAGDLTLTSAVSSTGAAAVSLTSTTGSVIFDTGSSATSGATGSVTVNADNNIVAPADLTAIITAGTANLTATNGDVGAGGMGNAVRIDVSTLTGAVGGDATIINLGTGTLDARFAGSMTSTLSFTHGGNFSVAATRSITGQNISITAADIALAGLLTAGSTVSITNNAPGTIGVGAAAGDLTITKADLANITAATLIIGSTNTTGITVDNVAEMDVANITSMFLLALADGADITFSGAASTLHGLTARADDSINVNVNLISSLGILTLEANADMASDTDGDKINIANGVTISTSSPMGGAITLTASGGIMGAGSLTLESNGALTLNNAITALGSLTLRAMGGITLNGAGSGDIISITANDGVTIAANLTSTGGGLSINADLNADATGVFTLASGATITTGNSNLNISASDVVIDGNINAGTAVVAIAPTTARSIGLGTAPGDMQISGTELSHITASTLSLGNGLTTIFSIDSVAAGDTANIANLITLLGADIEITGAFNTSSASLAFAPANPGVINVGMTSTMGQMNISNAELQFITTRNLQIGGGGTTNIFVNGVASGDTAGVDGAVTFLAGGTISFINNASTFKALTVNARNGIRINRDLTTTVGDLLLDADTNTSLDGDDDIIIASGRTITSAGLLSMRAFSSSITGNGSLTLLANSGVTIQQNLTTSGLTTINADLNADNSGTMLLSSGAVISTSGNNLSISAADLTLDGSINAGAGSVTITRSAMGTIGLGTAMGDLMLSGAEMGRILGTNMTIGGSTITSMTVSGVTANNSNLIAETLTLRAGAGAITFNGAGSVFNALDARASGGITVSAALSTDSGKMRLDGNSDGIGNDKITLGANLTANIPPAAGASPTVGFNIDLVSAVLLDANITIAARDTRFLSTLDSANATSRALTINSINSGVTTFGGHVGATNRLFTLTTNADGITQLGGDIRTNGTITFNDAIRLTGDSVVQAAAGLGVFFNSTVDTAASSMTNRSLTVLVNRGTAAGGTNVPIISFAAGVGATKALNNLFLNHDAANPGDDRANVPGIATIVARPRDGSGNVIATPTNFNMVFNTSGTFRMGRNEKLTSAGSLTINAPTAAFLSDMNSIGNMRVNSPSITLQRRAAGTLLGSLGGTGQDDGLDFVSGGTISFTSEPVAVGSGINPRFGTRDGSGDVNATLINFIFQAFGDVTIALVNSSGSPIRTLDLRSSGPTNTNLANTIAGAIPRETRHGDVGQEISVAQAQFEQIKQLGIVPRNPTAAELVELLTGSATFDDFPRKNPPTAEDYTTVVNRLPSDRVDALLNAYDAVFNKTLVGDDGKPVLDEKGNVRRVSRTQEIQEALLASVRRFREATKSRSADVDPTAFVSFLESGEEEARSLGYVRQLATFLNELDRIGLTARELSQSKAIILNPVRPRGIRNVQQFEAIIRAAAPAATAMK